MIYDNILWAKFAAASLAGCNNVGMACEDADRMLQEYKKRFIKNPLKSEPEENRASNTQ